MDSWTQATQGMNDRKLCWTVSQMLKDVRFGAENDQSYGFSHEDRGNQFCFLQPIRSFQCQIVLGAILKMWGNFEGNFVTFLELGFNYFRHL